MSKTRRRLRRAVILALEAVAGLTLVFLLVMAGTIWRLSEGPIEVEFLTESIEQALSDPETGLRVDVGTTQLTWEGWEGLSRGIDIRLLDVAAYDAEGAPIAEVDTMAVAFSLQSLVRGELAPTRLEVVAPSILLTYAADGSIGIGHTADGFATGAQDVSDETALFDLIIEELSRPPDASRQFGNLRSFEVRDASLEVLDEYHGTVWKTANANLILRRVESGANLEAAFAVRLEQEATFFSVSAHFDRDDQSVRLSVGFDSIRPSLLAAQLPYLVDFAAFDYPVGGQVDATLRADNLDLIMSLDVSFGDTVGTIGASGRYGLGNDAVVIDATMTQMSLSKLATALPWLSPLSGFDVTVDGEAQLVVEPSGIQSLGFVFRSGGGSITLPDQLNRPIEVVSIELEGAMAGAGAALDLARADIAFGTSRFTGSATAFGGEDGYEVSLQGSLTNLGVAEIDQYWPLGVSTSARSWVQNRIVAGNFDRIDLDLYGLLDTDQYSFSGLENRLDFAFSDVSLIYVPGMPPLDGMNGTGYFDGREFRVAVDEGATTFDLTSGPATVVIDGFDDPLPEVRVESSLHGDVRNHFRMIDHEPLSFLSSYGFSPDEARGQGSLNLAIAFALDSSVQLDAIAISIAAELTDATVPEMVAGDPLTDADLTLSVTNAAMHVEGRGLLNGTEIALSRDENFAGRGDHLAQSTMRGVFDSRQLSELGFDLQRWAEGPVGMSARFTEYRDDTARIDAALDLSAATASIPALVWNKAAGSPASAEFSLSLRGGNVESIDRFQVDGDGLSATGRASYTTDGNLQAVDLASLTVGRTQIVGRVETTANDGLAIRIDGGTLDLKPYLDDDGTDDGDGGSRLTSISMALDRLWVTSTGFVSQVTGTTQLVGSIWTSAQIGAAASSGVPISLTLEPTDAGRFLRVTTDDAGSLLRDLDLVESVRNGRMVIAARFRDAEPGRPLVGDMDVSDFRLIDAPLVARIISIAGVTGILDALQGEGIGFGRLATTFRLLGDTLELREGSMVGASLGVTFDGTVDIEQDLVSLRGALAPAYAVNGILGEIPLIGDVLVGGEGEGIFAVTYEASGAAGNPQVAVNPLSAFTPGVLRNIFPGG